MISLGFDLSLNHSGAVALDEAGKVDGYWFVSKKKGAVDQSNCRGYRLPVKKNDIDPEIYQLKRMLFYKKWINKVILESGAEYAGLEGYAYSAISNSSYQYGELGCCARMELARNSCAFRIHDPKSVKMFAFGKGNADASQLLEIVPESLRSEWKRIERGLKGQQVAEDLAVAYWMARLVWIEVELRAGRKLLSSLKPHEIRVFNRVTKTYPTNLLDREWCTYESAVNS